MQKRNEPALILEAAVLNSAFNDNRKTLVYCRESRDEGGENYSRIETQRDILLNFCRQKGLVNIVGVVMDDNVSGTDFSRFDQIIAMAEKGLVEVIVFKDESRLGRNLYESLRFIQLLERIGVEILFESEDYNEDFFPLKAWFNEQRAKEDSQKIRRVLKHKMLMGELVVKAPYGYLKREGGFVPNPETAGIVREIFRRYNEGAGTGAIASVLNSKGVPTPSAVSGSANRRCTQWNSQHIRRILSNEVYAGKMVYGKRQKQSFKSKKTVSTPSKDWIVIENRHEAIVPQAVFDKVQALKSKPARNTARVNSTNPLAGLLICGKCGSNMVLRTGKSRRNAYICGKYNKEGAISGDGLKGCISHHIGQQELLEALSAGLVALVQAHEHYVGTLLENTGSGTTATPSEIEMLKARIRQTEEIIEKIYDDRLAQVISEELFKTKYRQYNATAENYRMRLKALTFKEIESGMTLAAVCRWLQEGILNKTLMRQYIEKIYVFLPGEIETCTSARQYLPEQDYAVVSKRGGAVIITV